LSIHYKEKLKLTNNEIFLRKVKKNASPISSEIINLFESYSEEEGKMSLERIFENLSEEDEDKVIESLESLTSHEILIHVD
jgi:predicted nuclease of restriction endonuclease-like RecB superfamily